MTEVRPVAALRARRLHPQPAEGARILDIGGVALRRPLRRAGPDGLPVRVRGDRDRRPAERGPPRALPGRPDADDGRRRRRAGLYRYHSMTDLSSTRQPRSTWSTAARASSTSPGPRRSRCWRRPGASSSRAASSRSTRPTPHLTRLQTGRLHRPRPQVRVPAHRNGGHVARQRLRHRTGRGHQLRRRLRRPGAFDPTSSPPSAASSTTSRTATCSPTCAGSRTADGRASLERAWWSIGGDAGHAPAGARQGPPHARPLKPTDARPRRFRGLPVPRRGERAVTSPSRSRAC